MIYKSRLTEFLVYDIRAYQSVCACRIRPIQVSTYSGYDLCHLGLHAVTQSDRCWHTISSASQLS